MIIVNPNRLSTPTHFQVSFYLTPPYTAAEFKVVDDGTWRAVCGVFERPTSNPLPKFGTIFTEGGHNAAPHEGEGIPGVSRLYNYTGVDFAPAPWHPEYPAGSYVLAMDPVPHGDDGHFDKMWMLYTIEPGVDTPSRAWRVQVNIVHGTEEEIKDAHRRRRGGCLIPWWSWPGPRGLDHAKAQYERMVKTGEIGLEPAEATKRPEAKAKRAPAKKKSSGPKPKKRPK